MLSRTLEDELVVFREHGFLTTHLMIETLLVQDEYDRKGIQVPADLEHVYQRIVKIQEAIDLFNVEVWLLWLYSRQAMESTDRYLEANTETVNLLIGSLAGRCMITLRWRNQDLENKHHYVSLIGAEKLTLLKRDSNTVHGLCGLQGIGMNGDSAAKLILESVRSSRELANNIHKAPEGTMIG